MFDENNLVFSVTNICPCCGLQNVTLYSQIETDVSKEHVRSIFRDKNVCGEESVGLFMHIVQNMWLLRSMGLNEEMEPVLENR